MPRSGDRASSEAAGGAAEIITFYSYKGGTGRTMSLANAAWVLASSGYRVLAVDWDLEAPGLHTYFRPFLIDPLLESTDGLIDMVIDYVTEAVTESAESVPSDWYHRHADILRYAVSLDHEFAAGGSLDLLGAGRQTPSYSVRVNTFDWNDFYERLGGGPFLDAVRRNMKSEYDFVLIDSRTGVSDTSGICTVHMPDALVVCFTLNNQSILGASGVAASVLDQRGSGFPIFPVPMRVELAEKDKVEERRALSRTRFARFPSSISDASARDAYWDEVEVLYWPYYAYEEVLAAIAEQSPAPRHSLLAASERLCSKLIRRPVRLPPIPEPKRQRLLALYSPGTPDADAGTLAEVAEETFQRLGEEERAESRTVFGRLVRASRPGRGADSPSPAPLEDVERYSDTVGSWISSGVLKTVPGAPGDQFLTITDAALLEDWERLRDWIDEDRAFLIWRQDLKEGADRWLVTDRDSEVLLKGSLLASALEWRRARSEQLSDAELAFIAASRESRILLRAVLGSVGAVVLLVVVLRQLVLDPGVARIGDLLTVLGL